MIISFIRSRMREKTLPQIMAAAAKTCLQAGRAIIGQADRPLFRAADDFDERWGTDTEAWVPLARLEFPKDMARHCIQYEASRSDALSEAIEVAGIDPAEFSFIDIGSGKGRVVLCASQMPFRRTIGVEYSQSLTDVALANAAIFTERGGSLVAPEFHCGDAAEYEWPVGPLFLWFYNPFGPPILQRFLDALESRRTGAERTLLAYSNPRHIDEFERRDRWSHVASGDDLDVLELR